MLLQASGKTQISICHFSADLTILGAGPQEKTLRTQCKELRIVSAVRLPGHIEDILPPIFEGLPYLCFAPITRVCPTPFSKPPPRGCHWLLFLPPERIVSLMGSSPGEWLAREVSADALFQSLNYRSLTS